MSSVVVSLAAVFGFLAVALGAFGAHGLRNSLSPEMLAVYQTGVQYHFYHALALLLVGVLMQQGLSSGVLRAAAWLFALGIILFSGSLYALAISEIKVLGAITPLGGLMFLAAWVCLAVAAWKGV
jgi:uncharacterized membrane protein YgdD (TMEM256/DUF423 family)